MKRLVSWIVTLIVGVTIVLYAVSNRAPLEVDLWPLPFSPVVPAFAPVLAAAFVAFIAGGAVMWLSSGRVRQRARREHRRADSLEKDLETLKSQIDELEHRQRPPQADES